MAKQNKINIGDKILNFIGKPLPGSARVKKIWNNPFVITAICAAVLTLGILSVVGAAPVAGAIGFIGGEMIVSSGLGVILGGALSVFKTRDFLKNRKQKKAAATQAAAAQQQLAAQNMLWAQADDTLTKIAADFAARSRAAGLVQADAEPTARAHKSPASAYTGQAIAQELPRIAQGLSKLT